MFLDVWCLVLFCSNLHFSSHPDIYLVGLFSVSRCAHSLLTCNYASNIDIYLGFVDCIYICWHFSCSFTNYDSSFCSANLLDLAFHVLCFYLLILFIHISRNFSFLLSISSSDDFFFLLFFLLFFFFFHSARSLSVSLFLFHTQLICYVHLFTFYCIKYIIKMSYHLLY